MAANKRKLRRNDIKRSNMDVSLTENAKLEEEKLRYSRQEVKRNRKNMDFQEQRKGKARRKIVAASNRAGSKSDYEKMNRSERMMQRKLQFRKKAIFSLSTALLSMGALVLLLWYFSFDSVDLEKYVTVSYDGYDTHGTAYPHVNALGKYSMFLGMLNCQIASGENVQNGQLENGDEIIIDVAYDKETAREQKLRVRHAKIKTEVSGLEEGKKLSVEDLFEHVKISYTGTAPELSVDLSNENTDTYLSGIVYKIENKKEFYDIGETFAVTADISIEEAVKDGYALEETETGYRKEYTIENQDQYLREASEITPQQIEELNQAGAKLFGDAREYGLRIFSEANLMPIWVNNKTTFKWSNPKLQSAYFNVLETEYFGKTEVHNNDLKLVYQATLSQADGVSCQTQVVVRFTDLMKKADGTVDLALDSGKIIAASYRKSNIKELVNDAYNEEYESTEIPLT